MYQLVCTSEMRGDYNGLQVSAFSVTGSRRARTSYLLPRGT